MLVEVQNFIENALPIIGAMFLVVFFLILLIRIIFRFILWLAVKKYQTLKKVGSAIINKPLKKNLPKEDDERFRKKDELSKSKSDGYQIIGNKQEKDDLKKPEIIDVVKPIGFWTSLVLGQKLTYLLSSAKLMNQSKKGFWTSMVEAEARAAGRQRGKGRY